ncbi:MAG: hypothetical protein A2W25_11275 [candidate division Zixibacteria bacterium RBG_16_53_22]|nr:MAG: hypothetical protein A2W25_11275 [candidate division Zixibacteria bacterium RBG_16_53_22]
MNESFPPASRTEMPKGFDQNLTSIKNSRRIRNGERKMGDTMTRNQCKIFEDVFEPGLNTETPRQ